MNAGVECDLTHLDPCTLYFDRPPMQGKPSESYKVDTLYTSHCFTRSPKHGEVYGKDLIHPDLYELRLYDIRRYELSKNLPAIIQSLPTRKPRQNSSSQRSNFFTVESVLENGSTVEYEIFFKVRKIGKGSLQMIIETAFVRDPEFESSRPTGRPISFWIILHNTMNNIRIRT
jgi:hypothetical protein